MDPNAVSVLDLSAAEKLQWVEDLWDDLAPSPSDVPVHESMIHRAVKAVAHRAGLARPATCHAFRQSLATRVLADGYGQ